MRFYALLWPYLRLYGNVFRRLLQFRRENGPAPVHAESRRVAGFNVHYIWITYALNVHLSRRRVGPSGRCGKDERTETKVEGKD